MKVCLQPGFVLHTRPFRETSLLVSLLTESYGRIDLLAKGVKKPKSTQQGLLQPFNTLLVSWSGRSSLVSLTHAEAVGVPLCLSGKGLMSALYMNELLIKLLKSEDAHQELFYMYKECLYSLENTPPQIVLRRFEKHLLKSIGYDFLTGYDSSGFPIDVNSSYLIEFESGLTKVSSSYIGNTHIISGQSINDYYHDIFNNEATLKEMKQLMRLLIQHHLGHKKCVSRLFFQNS